MLTSGGPGRGPVALRRGGELAPPAGPADTLVRLVLLVREVLGERHPLPQRPHAEGPPLRRIGVDALRHRLLGRQRLPPHVRGRNARVTVARVRCRSGNGRRAGGVRGRARPGAGPVHGRARPGAGPCDGGGAGGVCGRALAGTGAGRDVLSRPTPRRGARDLRRYTGAGTARRGRRRPGGRGGAGTPRSAEPGPAVPGAGVPWAGGPSACGPTCGGATGCAWGGV